MDLNVVDYPLIAIARASTLTFRNHSVFLEFGTSYDPYLALYTFDNTRPTPEHAPLEQVAATHEALELLTNVWPGWLAENSLHVTKTRSELLQFTIIGKLLGQRLHYKKIYSFQAVGVDSDFSIVFFQLADVSIRETHPGGKLTYGE